MRNDRGVQSDKLETVSITLKSNVDLGIPSDGIQGVRTGSCEPVLGMPG